MACGIINNVLDLLLRSCNLYYHCNVTSKFWKIIGINYENYYLRISSLDEYIYHGTLIFFKYNQQDATLHNILYYCQCSTCFRRFPRPSSGVQNCTHSVWYMSSLLLLPLVSVSCSNSPMLAGAAASLTYTRCCVYSF